MRAFSVKSNRMAIVTLLLLMAAANLFAVTITLKNGKSFKGEIVSENANFYSLQIGSNKVQIAKAMVAEITGLPKDKTPDSPAVEPGKSPEKKPAVKKSAETLKEAASSQTPPSPKLREGMRLEVSLKTGARLTATLISFDDASLSLQADNGSKISVFRKTVSELREIAPEPEKIETKATKAEEQSEAKNDSPKPADSVVPPTPAKKAESKAIPPEPLPPEVKPDTVSKKEPEKRAPASDTAAKKTVSPPAEKPPAAAQSQTPDSQAVFVPEVGKRVDLDLKTGATLTATVVALDDKTLTLRADNGSNLTVFRKTIVSMRESSKPAPPPVIDTPAVVEPPPPPPRVRRKALNRKGEILLKNGVELKGTLIAEEELYFAFTMREGTNVNVPKRLIRSVDGKPCEIKSDSSSKAFDTSAQLHKAVPPSFSDMETSPDDSAASNELMDIVERPLPRVALAPGVTMQQIADSLTSSTALQRSAALRQLGAMGQWASGALPQIVKLLSDPELTPLLPPAGVDSASIQALLSPGLEAGRALARMGPRGHQELIKASRHDDAMVRMRAVFGLGEASDPGAREPIAAALADVDARVRAAAAWSMHFRSGVPKLIGLLKDADSTVRLYAAATLGEMGDESAGKPLTVLLNDPAASVRQQAAATLGMLNIADAAVQLANCTIDKSYGVRKAAIEALGAVGTPAGVPALITALKDTSETIRRAAAEALGSIRDIRAFLPLLAVRQEKNDVVREAADRSLRQLSDLRLLANSLDDPRPPVRRNASQILWLLTAQDFGVDKLAWLGWMEKEGR